MLFNLLRYFFPTFNLSWKIRLLTYWFVWLAAGIIFYGYYCEFGFIKGFYMAINIGYSIGWNYPPTPTDTPTLLFSIGFELFGSSAVAYSLQIFAECILLDDRAWYVKALKREQHEQNQQSKDWKVKFLSWIEMQSQNLIPFAVCMIWLCGGALTAWFYIDIWNPYESAYFAFSSLATGGQQEIPEDSPKNFYLVVALYSALGTPIMAYTLGSIASLFIVGPNIKVLEVIEKKITYDDLRTMQKYGLENKDGTMDRAEYLILCMLRLGVVDPELVQAIVTRYNDLDLSGDGLLSYKELLEQDESGLEKGRGLKVKIQRRSTRRASKFGSTSQDTNDILFQEKSTNGNNENENENENGDDDELDELDELEKCDTTLMGKEKKEHRGRGRVREEERSRDNEDNQGSQDNQEKGESNSTRSHSLESSSFRPIQHPNKAASPSPSSSSSPAHHPPRPRPSLLAGQQISARVSKLKQERSKNKSFKSMTSSPVRPAPLSPLITRYLPRAPKSNTVYMEEGITFSQPRHPSSSSAASAASVSASSRSLPGRSTAVSSSRYPLTTLLPSEDPER